MARQSPAVELAELIVKHRPGRSAAEAFEVARNLVRAARVLRRLYEHRLNEPIPEPYRAADALREERLANRIALHAAIIGAAVAFNDDARGHSVYLHFGPDAQRQPGNTMGGCETGWGIGA